MKNLHLLTVSLVFFFTSSAFTQVKEATFYAKGKYEKCIKKSQKRLDNVGDPLVFQQLIGFAKFQLSNQQRDDSLLISALRHLDMSGANPSSIFFKEEREAQKKDVYMKSEVLILKFGQVGDTATGWKIGGILAKVFGDTLPQFKPKKVKKILDVVIQKGSELGPSLLKSARELIGIPYVYGGESTSGFDCSGFIKYIYAKEEVELPHSARMQAEKGVHVPIVELKTGDLLFFATGKDKSTISHTSMFFEENGVRGIIHSSSSKGVTETHWDSGEWKNYWESKIVKGINLSQ